MPSVSWKHENVDGKLRLTIDADPVPRGARLWIARSATTDFRTVQWKEQAVSFSDGKIVAEVMAPEAGHLAFFGELDYEVDGLSYHLSTQVRMTE